MAQIVLQPISVGMSVKYILFLSAVPGFLDARVLMPKAAQALYMQLTTATQEVQDEIVNVHNRFRRNVHPPARNMLKMQWSPEAAYNARILAQYCDLAESDPMERRLSNTFCGENVHMEPFPISWSEVIETWYNESRHFKYGEWTMDDDVKTNHYTQLVWASSYLIGCGVASCRKNREPQYIYICHYCHEGNDPDMINMPYKKGSWCGDCPDQCEDKLCMNPCFYFDEYQDCEKKARILGCTHPTINLLCPATCMCTTEIK
ncbi:cysteine-rich secretory protein 1 [Dipodomys spectabilis]|uniref:cysteine-rich secretory protein 1 n=1 Tax=Dipodomys spectabilis TaxID=105255 RepID=UPI001C53A61B|nr:cysteine-rich secretory protein 1 [Dipodomys spectabilis]